MAPKQTRSAKGRASDSAIRPPTNGELGADLLSKLYRFERDAELTLCYKDISDDFERAGHDLLDHLQPAVLARVLPFHYGKGVSYLLKRLAQPPWVLSASELYHAFDLSVFRSARFFQQLDALYAQCRQSQDAALTKSAVLDRIAHAARIRHDASSETRSKRPGVSAKLNFAPDDVAQVALASGLHPLRFSKHKNASVKRTGPVDEGSREPGVLASREHNAQKNDSADARSGTVTLEADDGLLQHEPDLMSHANFPSNHCDEWQDGITHRIHKRKRSESAEALKHSKRPRQNPDGSSMSKAQPRSLSLDAARPRTITPAEESGSDSDNATDYASHGDNDGSSCRNSDSEDHVDDLVKSHIESNLAADDDHNEDDVPDAELGRHAATPLSQGRIEDSIDDINYAYCSDSAIEHEGQQREPSEPAQDDGAEQSDVFQLDTLCDTSIISTVKEPLPLPHSAPERPRHLAGLAAFTPDASIPPSAAPAPARAPVRSPPLAVTLTPALAVLNSSADTPGDVSGQTDSLCANVNNSPNDHPPDARAAAGTSTIVQSTSASVAGKTPAGPHSACANVSGVPHAMPLTLNTAPFDVHRFAPGNWLSDDDIRRVLDPICRGTDTNVIWILEASEITDWTSWAKGRRDFRSNFSERTTLFPVCLRDHWILIVVDKDLRSVSVLNSKVLYDVGDLMPMINAFLLRLSYARGIDWQFPKLIDIPQQNNSDDCGVHVILNAFYVLADVYPPSIHDIPFWRHILPMLLDNRIEPTDVVRLVPVTLGAMHNAISLLTSMMARLTRRKYLTKKSASTLQSDLDIRREFEKRLCSSAKEADRDAADALGKAIASYEDDMTKTEALLTALDSSRTTIEGWFNSLCDLHDLIRERDGQKSRDFSRSVGLGLG
ncbi:hypothetical protein MBLNU459_g7279t1 [Dothideomycetes sp. NU459]